MVHVDLRTHQVSRLSQLEDAFRQCCHWMVDNAHCDYNSAVALFSVCVWLGHHRQYGSMVVVDDGPSAVRSCIDGP